MTQSQVQPLADQSNPAPGALPIFNKKVPVKSRDENDVYFRARKSKCNSVWCPACSKGVLSQRISHDMAQFDWKRTREIVLTIDPALFKSGQKAFEYVKEHKLLAHFVRNLQRGKKIKAGKRWVTKYRPVSISKWIWFLEWHSDGRPHWHLIIESNQYGRFAMIGQDMIHHYWPVGKWIHESHISSLEHWHNKVGYFNTHGYFQDDKEHQTRLPAWALNIPGLRIRRSCHSRRGNLGPDKRSDYGKEPCAPTLLDPDTGEIFTPSTITYERRLKLCGRCTILTAFKKDRQVDGLLNIPYTAIRKSFPGKYREASGYLFSLDQQKSEALLAQLISSKSIAYLSSATPQPRAIVKRWCSQCGDHTIQKFIEAKASTDQYTCLRCKNPCEHKSRRYTNLGLQDPDKSF